MKVNIQKLQGGGATFTPIVRSAPTRSTPSTSNSQQSQSQSSLLSDDLYKKLLGEGITNDVNAFVESIMQLESGSGSMYPYLSSQNQSSVLRQMGQINQLMRSAKDFKESADTAKKNEAWYETAVGGHGELYVKDESGLVKAITLDSFTKNPEYKPLTVAELYLERELNPQLTNQNQVFNVGNNSVGLSKITEHIKGLIAAFGTEEISETKTYSKSQVLQQLGALTGKKPTAEEAEGVKKLLEISQTPGDYVKVLQENSSERRYANKAAKYIWSTLGDSAQKKLKVTATLNGITGPEELILDMILGQTNAKTKTDITPDTVSASGSGADGEFKDKPITPFELFHNGKTGKKDFIWNDPATGKTFNLVATGISKLTSVEGKPLGMSTLRTILNTEVGTLVDTSKAFYGDQKVDPNDLQNIIYNGNDAARVYMPVSANGAPDYNKLKEIKTLEEQIVLDPNLTSEQINKIFAERGLSFVQVDNNKQYIMNNRFKPFLVMYGYTGEDALSTHNNSKIKALSSTEEDGVVDTLKTVWTNEKVENPPIGWDWATTYYSGMIAIPYRDDSSMYTASIAKNLLSQQVNLEHALAKQKLQNATKVNADSNLLFK